VYHFIKYTHRFRKINPRRVVPNTSLKQEKTGAFFISYKYRQYCLKKPFLKEKIMKNLLLTAVLLTLVVFGQVFAEPNDGSETGNLWDLTNVSLSFGNFDWFNASSLS
jgi:hypothetical protein